MKIWIIILIILIPSVFGSGEICQISIDNLSWSNVTNTRWGGCIDTENKIGYIQNIEECTVYNIRCKNTTTTWTYNSVKTECGWDGMYLALVFIGILFIGAGVILYLMKRKEKEEK